MKANEDIYANRRLGDLSPREIAELITDDVLTMHSVERSKEEIYRRVALLVGERDSQLRQRSPGSGLWWPLGRTGLRF